MSQKKSADRSASSISLDLKRHRTIVTSHAIKTRLGLSFILKAHLSPFCPWAFIAEER